MYWYYRHIFSQSIRPAFAPLSQRSLYLDEILLLLLQYSFHSQNLDEASDTSSWEFLIHEGLFNAFLFAGLYGMLP